MSDPRRDEQFDNELLAFLAAEAGDRRGVRSAAEIAMRISPAPRAGTFGTRTGLPLAWLILAGLLAIALLGAVLIGVGGRRDSLAVVPTPSPSAGSTTYAPIFLRLDDGELAAIRVDANGGETELLRLPNANLLGNNPYGGAVSTSGLLAVPRPAALKFRWEIVDLAKPEAEPFVVPGTEQAREPFLPTTPYVGLDDVGGAFWGPRDQLAIVTFELVPTGDPSSYSRDWYLTFVDGRTGDARRVDVPDGDEYVLPRWAPDGSGVLLESRVTEQVTGVLRQDGTIDREIPDEAWSFCEDIARAGTDCQSPDRAIVVRMPGKVAPSHGPAFEVPAATWAGWMEVPS